MESDRTELERLASLAGLLPSYEDAHGATVAVAASALRGVLRAAGVDAPDGAAARRLAREREARPWLRELDDVYVFDADAAASVTVAHRGDARDGVRRFRIVAEDGTETSGSFAFAALALVDRTDIDGRTYERRRLPIPAPLAPGYYRMEVRAENGDASATTLVAAPPACHLPEAVERRGVWGLAIQVYALRSARNWGIGDFTDLSELCAIVDRAGGSAVGLSPLHALRYGANAGVSPYAPASRAFLNWIYLDVEALPGFDPRDVDRAELARVRAAEFVAYAPVAALKRAVARSAYERFEASASGADREAFAAFVRDGGERLRRATVFAVLAERFDDDPAYGADWLAWPEPFRDPASAAVRAFERERAPDVAFEAFLQWQADAQLARCAAAFRGPLGLYRDLAVGADLAGADTWSDRAALTRAAAVGAPPDILNVRGQNWGVAPFDPIGLRRAGYEAFVALLRANMRHAGALRIDHVMALARLYWVPAGAAATEGAYVTYRLDELLGIVALESRRARCAVVGEDLGTVPAGFREKLAAKNILSYRLLQFERDDAGFAAPGDYPRAALASIATHDLPPLGAYWTASDIATRERLGLFADAAAARDARAARAREREQLLAILRAGDFVDARDEERFRSAADRADDAATLAEIALAANRFLASSDARLLMVQLEDALGDVTQANVPTTVDEHPNWRRRASIALDDLADDPRFVALANALRPDRGARAERGQAR